MRSCFIALALFAALGAVPCLYAQRPSLYLIDTFPGAEVPTALSMTPDGRTIVGGVDTEDDTRLFRWTTVGGMQDLGRFDIFHPRASVSRDGQAIVGRALDESGESFAYRWTVAGGGMEILPSPAITSIDDTTVGPCSGNGRVVFGTLDPYFMWDQEALVRWVDDEVETFPIEGINDVSACSDDGSVVYGYRFVVAWPGYSLFRWTPEEGFEDLFEVEEGVFPESIDAACSPDGSVVTANVKLPDGSQHRGVIWTEATGVQILDGPTALEESYDTYVFDCSDDGSIAVGKVHRWLKAPPAEATGEASAETLSGLCVWFDGKPVFLNDLLEDRGFDLTNWVFSDLRLCSGDGTILVGSGRRYDPKTEEYEWGEFRADILEPTPSLPNRPPVAKAGKNVVVRTKASKARVRLDGSGSRDPDGDKLKYAWSAKKIEFAGAKTARPSAVFPVGKTTVKLTVTDARGVKRSDTVVVTVIQTRRTGAADEPLDDEGAIPSL